MKLIAHTDSAESHVGQELGFVDWRDRFDGFHFDNYPVFNDQINSISHFEFVAFINNRQGNFRSQIKASRAEFVCEAELVGTLEKAWSEKRVNLHRGVHYCACDLVYVEPMGACRACHIDCITDFPVFLCDRRGETCFLVSIWEITHHRESQG